ncbi:F-box/WD repeat-containing protein 7 [Neocloeon triangulifer]|uniref:F-box/WD repeat-containing protein 7 n=1 Tax=Neocloeon triangulifer TaxID=2078957 RepID=UPI00286F6261|nr:F-box/WD repeat-containing protein 7 [Neocloeon triangulifer]
MDGAERGHSEDLWWDCCGNSSSQVHTTATDSPPLGTDSGSPTLADEEVDDVLNQQPVEDILSNKLALYSSSEESEEAIEDMGSSQSKEESVAAVEDVIDSPGDESPEEAKTRWQLSPPTLVSDPNDPTPSTSSETAVSDTVGDEGPKDPEELTPWNSQEISSRKRKLNNLETEAECSDKFPRKRGPGSDSFEDSSTDEGESETALECKRLRKPYQLGKPWSRKIGVFTTPQPLKLRKWMETYKNWSSDERRVAIDALIGECYLEDALYMMNKIEPHLQRDFIFLLPKELALHVLSFLQPVDLLRAAQTCRYWRILTEDNLLWRGKCKAAGIDSPWTPPSSRKEYTTSSRLSQFSSLSSGAGSSSENPRFSPSASTSYSTITQPPSSPWKSAYLRQHCIEMNWRSKPIRQPKVLKGHDDHVITCLQFSDNKILSGSDDNTLRVWSATTGKCLRVLVGHIGGVWSSQMSGSTIISGSTDRTLKVWNAESGQCLHTLYGHTSTVRCMHLHGKKVVSGSRDATLRVWNIESGSCLHVLVGHLAAVRCVQYDGKLVVSGAYDYMVKVWNPEREECLHTLQGHTNRVYSLQFDGKHVVSGSLDTSIRVWDVKTGTLRHTLMGHQSLTSGMELRNRILVSGNADSTVKVWDIVTGRCLQTLSGPNKHQSAVTCLQFNSKFVITSSDDGTVKLWDVKTGEFIRNLIALDSGGSGGVVWRIRATDTTLVCAVGSRNGTEETKLLVLNFDVNTEDEYTQTVAVCTSPSLFEDEDLHTS